MDKLRLLKQEFAKMDFTGLRRVENHLRYLGYKDHLNSHPLYAKAHAIAKLFTAHKKHVYENDLIAGSILGCYSNSYTGDELAYANTIVKSYGVNTFWTNVDHDAINFEMALNLGIGGIINKIEASLKCHTDEKKRRFLKAAHITMTAFSEMIYGYGEAAQKKAESTGAQNLYKIACICQKVAYSKPENFHEALQLVWLIHTSFLYEDRYAMALGRLDQYLYPFYKNDDITKEHATELIACTLYKIYERNLLMPNISDLGRDDVVNIAIGGVKRDGSDAVNELSYIILDAVKECRIPGPNLSARISQKNPDAFLDKCLEVIGEGIGYPALMNDEVNIAALSHYGYPIEDCRDYCMVGCIENFLPGKQPPWSDGRYNSPKYLELALNNGKCMLTGVQMGPKTGDAAGFDTMEKLISATEIQMAHGAAEYVRIFNNEADRYDRELYAQPYISCYHDDCIGRGLDIRDGGSVYPSVHGAGCMGIGTMSDSLAAIEKIVFDENVLTVAQLRDILITDFDGREDIRSMLIKAPKYGNNNDYADKYAKWFVDIHYKLLSKHHTYDGGGIYVAIASNINNIPAGREIAATPDGRKSKMPLSDAASPSHGTDQSGITSALLSCAKPDYTKAACGTVLNVKFESSVFRPENIEKLRALIRVYFKRGGQEIQINCVSKAILEDAAKNPQDYKHLVVRVSGFSAFYVHLNQAVQKDILARTEHV